MKSETALKRMRDFVYSVAELRKAFPEHAKEIDRMAYDVGKNNLGSCGYATCDCQMSFEEFHRRQNIHNGTTKENYEFN